VLTPGYVSPVVERFTSEISAVTDPQAGMERLSTAAIELGFAGACGCFWPRMDLTAAKLPRPRVLLYGPANDPGLRRWFAEYVECALYELDPCYAVCHSMAVPFTWSSEEPHRVGGRCVSPEQRRALDALNRSTGIRSGIAVPLQTPGSWCGYCSYASKSPLEWILGNREALEDPLLAMSYRCYDATVGWLGALVARENGLSAQELECLGLLAAGKTVEEIAGICGMPYSTVRSRLRKAERKLAARNRSHAIATAAALGLLEDIC
jgi:DNA-binding CsgD family transcriptional regulator